MLVMIMYVLGVIGLESFIEIAADALLKKLDGYVPRNRRGYPRIKSLV